MSSKIETVSIPRELLERHLLKFSMAGLLFTKVEGLLKSYDELNEILAAPVVERQPNVIDLDAVDWETIQKAADESNWMPNEYMRNEWVSDVCNFLTYGRAEYSAPPELAELQATIAQLETKVNNAINLDFERRETIAQQDAEIERWKGYAANWEKTATTMCDSRAEKLKQVADGCIVSVFKAPVNVEDLEKLISCECFQLGDEMLVLHRPVERLKGEPACTSCDGSGEYIDAIGDWRGYCSCPAGVALKARPAPVSVAPEGWKLVPIEPTAEMLRPIVRNEWPTDWEIGKRLQRLRGPDVVCFNTETECAVGQYERMLAAAPNYLDKVKELNQ